MYFNVHSGSCAPAARTPNPLATIYVVMYSTVNWDSFTQALILTISFDRQLFAIIKLSLVVSLTAVCCAALIGFPLGALIAIKRFPGSRVLAIVFNALMGLPPVVVGLVVYLLLSRAGPLGSWGLLFTPAAMIIAQTILVIPIIAALTKQIIEDAWREYAEQLRSLGATPGQAVSILLWDTRFALTTVLFAGFGRAIAEVGAVMIVGGNIDGLTRVMTTAIALETSKGDLPLALALGTILLVIVFAINALAYAVREWAQRRYG